jgi:cytochrome c556
MKGFKRAATQFADAANQLSAASAARNKEAVFASIKQVGASCKSCHRVYRQK